MPWKHQHVYSIGDIQQRCLICEDLRRQAERGRNNVITDYDVLWDKLCKMKEDLFNQAEVVRNDWLVKAPGPHIGLQSSRLADMESKVLDVRDTANMLVDELIFLRGHQEAREGFNVNNDLAMAGELSDALKLLSSRFGVVFSFTQRSHVIGIKTPEQPNERGDVIIDITPNTAPVSEIADSLGTTIPKVNGAVRRLHLKPAGWVYWRLYDGTEPEPAGTYDLAQWKQLKEDLAGHVRVLPPARLLASSGIELEELADEGIQETLREWHSNDSSHYAKHLKGHNNGTE
jgi:hypothetical protein